MSGKRSIRSSIQKNMLIATALSILYVTTLWLTSDYTQYKKEARTLRDQQIQERKVRLQQRVDNVRNNIALVREQTRDRARSELRQSAGNAYNLTDHIYDAFHGTMSEDELQELIITALRPLRPKDGRRSFFVGTLDGVCRLDPENPQLEGRSLYDIRDTDGKYIFRDVIRLVKNSDEVFYTYQWPGKVEGVSASQVTLFVRRFDSLGWFICSRYHEEDLQKIMRNLVLNDIEQIKYGDDGSIFALHWNGTCLTGPSKGKNITDIPDSSSRYASSEIIELAKSGGGNIFFDMPQKGTGKDIPRMSYIAPVSDWQWLIGADILLDDIEDTYLESKQMLLGKLIKSLFSNLTVFLGLLLLAFLVTKKTADKTVASLNVFIDFFKRGAVTSDKIDVNSFDFSEFHELAASANSMIEQQNNAEDALRESQERYRNLFDASSEGIFVIQGNYIFNCNRMAYNLFRCEDDYLLGKPLFDFSPASQPNGFDSKEAGSLRIAAAYNGEEQFFEWRFLRCDGVQFDAEMYLNSIELTDKPYILALVRDITERKQAEIALQQSEEKYRALMENTADVIMRFDKDYRHLYVNRAIERYFDVGSDDFNGKTHGEMQFPEKMCRFWEKHIEKVFETGKMHRVEFSVETKLGLTYFDWALFPEFEGGGDVKSVLASSRDITESKKLESQLLQSQKMETVGRLAGGIAHDFNNMLTVISGNAEMAAMELGQDDTILREFISEISATSARATSLTRQLLAFSRHQIVKPQQLDLSDVISRMKNMLSHLISENIDFIVNPAEDLWPVTIDLGQIEQVMTNLVVNACDAMPDGGTLSISTRNHHMNDTDARNYSGAMAGNYVLLEVRDSGIGMDDETIGMIFEPFFTTKDISKGTGLGLSICYGIINQNNGYISVVSKPGEGSLFSILLPSTEKREEKSEKPNEVQNIEKGSETVLITEDEPMVRKMISRILKTNGYNVLLAEDGHDALETIKNYNSHIDLLISDMIMPKMDGRELAAEVRNIMPDIKVIFISGYTDDILRDMPDISNINFLQKPFSTPSLLKEVRKVLDS